MFICKIQLHKPVILTRYNWSTVENRKDLRIQACLSVCVCRYVCPLRDISGTARWIILKFLDNARGQKYKNHHKAVFWKTSLFSRKPLICCKKKFFVFLAVYGKTDPVICLKFWQNVEGIDSYDFKWLDWDNSYFLIKCMNLWHFFVTKKNVLGFFGILPLQCLKFW